MSPPTWSHRLARRAIQPLLGTQVTPNHLTTLRLLSGLAAVAAFSAGTPFWSHWGGVLFVLSAFLDRADGELARSSGRSSRRGHHYDLLSDALVTALVFVGIGIGARSGELGGLAPPMGLVAGVAVASVFWFLARFDDEEQAPFHGQSGFDPDDLLYLIGPLAWLGWLTPFLVAASIGAPLFAVWSLWYYRGQQHTNSA